MNLIGKELDGRYEILEEIGKGGMAYVYKSRDKQLGRYVAVKVLKEDYRDDKEFVRRFNIEAQAAARLSNPHIVSIYDVGCFDGLRYIVMEFVEGETLKSYIERRGVIPWREAAGYSIQICEGIEEAHRNSVIHRDIKPQNIIMTTGGVLKITDFGIARATTQTTMTMGSNNTIGTAHYLSPEQARGGYTDERTDIYSMGVVMYEMLTGTLPFDDNSPVAIAIKHLQEDAVPVTELNPDVPKSFEYIVMKAMSKEQDSRYLSATDMISDLKRMLENPNVDLTVAAAPIKRTRRSLDPFEDETDSTAKMPAIDDKSDFASDIPGYDIDDYDEQNQQYEMMEELNERRAKRIKRKQERKVAFIAFLTALAVLAAGFAVTYSFTDGFGIFGTQKNTVTIPNIVGMMLKDAQSQYGKEYSILEQSKEESTKPVGTILEQTPAGGEEVNNSDSIIIRVVVSSGSNSITLPNYNGMSIEEVQEDLEKLGIKYTVVEEANSNVEKGKVFNQYPSAGSKITSNDMVQLFVSKGIAEPTTKPDKNEDTSDSSVKSEENKTTTHTNTEQGETSESSTNKTDTESDRDDTTSGGSGTAGGREDTTSDDSDSSSGGETSGGGDTSGNDDTTSDGSDTTSGDSSENELES